MLTHGNLSFVTASWLADLTPMNEADVTLHVAPLSHGAGFHALAAIARGARQVIPWSAHFEPDAILELLARERVTNTWMVPTQIVMLIDAVAQQAKRRELPDLRHVVYGGAPFAPADLKRALEVFGPVFVQLFGQGETPMTATYLPAADHAAALAGECPERLASAGFARPGMDVRVLGDDDRELPTGDVGEVCVQGPAVMLGYWERPDATAEALRNGWLHTGDLGRFDDHGYLYLLDRAKDMIITGGSNVYAVEVEAALGRPRRGARRRGGRARRPHVGRARGRGRRRRRPGRRHGGGAVGALRHGARRVQATASLRLLRRPPAQCVRQGPETRAARRAGRDDIGI